MVALLSFNKKIFLRYLLIFVFFLAVQYQYFPAWYDAFLQIFIFVISLTVFAFNYKKENKSRVYIYIFMLQLLCSSLMQFVNYDVYGDIYGFNPVDAEFYRNYAITFRNKSFSQILAILGNDDLLIDDYGYPIIVYFSTIIFGNNFVFFLTLLNALVITIGCRYLYKLCVLFLPKSYSTFVMLIWGIMPYSIYTTAAGLKENFFVFFVILSLYYLYKYIIAKRLNYIFLFLLATSIVFLFRMVVGIALVLSLLSYLFFRIDVIASNLKKVLLLLSLLIICLFTIVATYIIGIRGYEYEILLNNASEKMGGLLGQVFNVIAGFIGPIPNFVSNSPEKITYITRYSFTPYYKIMISFYFWYALYLVIKDNKVIFLPFFVFFAINTTMLIFTFYTQHDRYQWPHIPMFMLLAHYGYFKSGKKTIVKRIYTMYTFFVLLIILVYNFR